MRVINMASISALLASSAGLVGAFTSRAALSRNAPRVTSLARAMSSKPMPHGDDKMPYYALGVNIARQVGGQTGFKTLLDDDELEIMLEGFTDTIRGTSTADAAEVLQTYGNALNAILAERSDNIIDRTKKEGDEFMANFLECNEEAVKTESGMVYCPMVEGTGAQPTTSNTVEVHYHGTLVDGTVFDSSVDRGQTIKFPLGGVIKGWQEGLAMMKEGGKATLVIPSELAYGDAGTGDVIGPGATLKFEVELFKVE